MTPRELPVEETLGWLRSVLPAAPARVLEVGCGRGDLALRLREVGYKVTPLDRAPDAVGLARAAGLDVVEADFLEYETGDPFDAVLFTRSLHHIHPLRDAVEKAAALLAPGGLVIGDEFARERVDGETAAWWADSCAVLGEVGLLPEEDDPSSDPLERWNARFLRHDPPPTTGADMLAELDRRFELVEVDERVPYHYRYAADRLPETPLGLRLATLLLDIERRRIAASDRSWGGLRFAARPRARP
jgi:SAM-dependent methyltransferase